MKKTKAGCIKYPIAIVLLLIASYANTKIIYDESIDGDSGLYTGASILPIGNDNALVNGRWSWPEYASVDTDSYLFILSDFQQVTEISITISNKEFYGDNQWSLYQKVGSNYKAIRLGDVTIDLLDNITSYQLYSSALPALTGGEFFLVNESAGKPTNRLGAAYDYQLSLSVLAVPLPGALNLFLLSMIALFHIKRRA